MNVRTAKKILKNTKCHIRPERNLYTSILWLHKRQVFRVIDYWGQTIILLK